MPTIKSIANKIAANKSVILRRGLIVGSAIAGLVFTAVAVTKITEEEEPLVDIEVVV